MDDRNYHIQPFYVMDILAKAKEMSNQGIDVIHLEVGEPDFPTPPLIKQAAIDAIKCGETLYTASLGLTELREKVANHYVNNFSCQLDFNRIAITSGASGALLLVLGALLNPEDELMLTDPGYPCNANFAYFLSLNLNQVNVDSSTQFQLTLENIKANWTQKTKAVLLASPANPTGTRVEVNELKNIVEFVSLHGATLIVDEIYHQLVYGIKAYTALEVSDKVIVINSFSKYFQMTGWRLGWIVAPKSLMPTLDKLSQNLFLCPSTIAQHAALFAFHDETIKLLEERREQLHKRRDFMVKALAEMGFIIPAVPVGAFYIYADCSAITDNAMQFCKDLLRVGHVAITPGHDFGHYKSNNYVRISYTQNMNLLKIAIEKMQHFINSIEKNIEQTS